MIKKITLIIINHDKITFSKLIAMLNLQSGLTIKIAIRTYWRF